MMHTSAATGVRAIAAARAQGFPIYGETLHQYLMYNSEDYKKPNGQIYHTYPSLKFPADQQALWEATNHGAIQCVATDEICCPLRIKLQGRRIDDTTGGNAGVEPRVSLIYTETVEKRGYSLNDFVGLISTNAAKIMGLYPRKGALAVGSDADIVLLDTRQRHIVRAAEMHEADYSPWEGRDLACWPSLDDAARQNHGRERRTQGRPHRRQIPAAQGAGRNPLTAGCVSALPITTARILMPRQRYSSRLLYPGVAMMPELETARSASFFATSVAVATSGPMLPNSTRNCSKASSSMRVDIQERN